MNLKFTSPSRTSLKSIKQSLVDTWSGAVSLFIDLSSSSSESSSPEDSADPLRSFKSTEKNYYHNISSNKHLYKTISFKNSPKEYTDKLNKNDLSCLLIYQYYFYFLFQLVSISSVFQRKSNDVF